MTMRLYPSRFIAPFQPPPPETITEDKWHHNHSQPDRNLTVKKAAGYLVAALAVFVIAPTQPVGAAGDGAFVPAVSTTSVRYDKTIIFDDLAYAPFFATPETITVDKYGRPFSEPTRRKRFSILDETFGPVLQPDNRNDGIGWHRPFSEPTRRKVFLEGRVAFSPTQPQANDGIGWHRPFSEPTRRVTTRQQQELSFAGKPFDTIIVGVPGDGAFVPAVVTTSVRYDKTVIFDDIVYPPFPIVAAGEIVTVDKYGRPFSEPTRRKQFSILDESFGPIVQPDQDDAIGWHRAFNEPTRRVTTRQQQALIQGPAQPITTTLEYAWYRALSDPTRRTVRVGEGAFASPYTPIVATTPGDDTARAFTVTTQVQYAKTIIFDDYAYAPYIQVVEGPEAQFTWRQPLSEPVRRKPFREGLSVVAPTQPQANDGIGWHRPFNEPTRRKVFLEGRVAYSPTLVQDAAIQAKWFQPFGVPRAAKRVPEFPAYSYSPYFVPPISGTGTEYNWWSNLSERIRVRSPVTQQQAVIQGPSQPITVTLEYAYYRPFSEPTRRKVVGYNQLFGPYVQQEIVTLDKWFIEFGRPRKPQPRLEGEYTLAPFPQVSGPDRWGQQLSLPTRRKVDVARFVQPPFIYTQATGTGLGTQQPWPPFSEPVRFKRALPIRLQQYLAYYPLLINLELDPACRIIVTLGDEVIDASQVDTSITSAADGIITTTDTDSSITPDEPNNIITVVC